MPPKCRPCRPCAGLVALQHSFCRLPGLVADGRDMGTVIFPRRPAEGVFDGQRLNGGLRDAISS